MDVTKLKMIETHKSVMNTGLVRVSSEIIQIWVVNYFEPQLIWQVKQLIFDCQPKNIICIQLVFCLRSILQFLVSPQNI